MSKTSQLNGEGVFSRALEASRLGYMLWLYGVVLVDLMVARVLNPGKTEQAMSQIGYAGMAICGAWIILFAFTVILMAANRKPANNKPRKGR